MIRGREVDLDGLQRRPLALRPVPGREERFSPQNIPLARVLAHTQAYAPPLPLLVAEHVTVSRVLDILTRTSGRQDGIRGIRFIGAPDIATPRHRDHMVVEGAALADHQVPPAVFAVQVGSFGPDAPRAAPEQFFLRQLLSCRKVDFEHADRRHGARCRGAVQIRVPIVVPDEAGVNAVEVEEDRVAPVV